MTVKMRTAVAVLEDTIHSSESDTVHKQTCIYIFLDSQFYLLCKIVLALEPHKGDLELSHNGNSGHS